MGVEMCSVFHYGCRGKREELWSRRKRQTQRPEHRRALGIDGQGGLQELVTLPSSRTESASEGWAAGAAAGPSGGEAVSDSVNYLLEIPRLERSPLNPFGSCSGHVCGGRGGAPVVKTWRSAGTLSKTAPARAPHKTAHSSFAERILL